MSDDTASKAFFANPDHDAARKEEERILKAMERKTAVKLYSPTTTSTLVSKPAAKPAAAAPTPVSRPAAPPAQPVHTPAPTPAPAPAPAPAPRSVEPGPGVATFHLSQQEQEDEMARREAARLAKDMGHLHVDVSHAQPAQPSSSLLARAAATASEGTDHKPHVEKSTVDVPKDRESNWGAEQQEQIRREEERMKSLFGAGAAPAASSGSQQKTAAPQPAKASPLGSGPSHAPTLVNVPVDANAPASVSGSYEREIWSELNKARSNPRSFANYLRTLEPCYSGNVFTFQGTNMKLETSEGVAALRDAIAELERTEPILGVLKLNEIFSRSALDLVNEHGAAGKIAAKTEEESRRAAERLIRYGTWKRKVIETIAYGPVAAKDVVAFWLIDDGTPERGNRRSILDRTFQVVGIASGPHAQLGKMVVVDWTEDFVEGAAAGKAVKTSGYVEQAAPSAEHSEARAGVLQELSDGSGFVIDVGALGVPKSALAVKLHNGAELQVAKSHDGKVFYYKYELPFAFRPDQVSAEFTADKHLLVKLKKPSSAGSAASETTLSQYALNPVSDRERVEIDIKETKDHLHLKSLPSKFNEEVTVKLRDSKVVVWESKHIVDDAEGRKIITSTQTLKLPFEVSSANCQILLHGAHDGATLQITKPTGGVGEVEIPISG